jgi:signal peptidase I
VTGVTAPRSRTGLSGRHVDVSDVAGRITRRLNPTAFAQTMIIVCLALIVWPASFGGRFGVVMVAGNSMEPTYILGDAVLTWREPVEIGDTILFRVPEGDPGAGNPVIHRVIGGDSDGWITQGDNTPAPDNWAPSNREVLGVAKFHVPIGGRVLAVMRSWLVIATLGGLAVGLLIWPDLEAASQEKADVKPTDRGRGRHKARRFSRARLV